MKIKINDKLRPFSHVPGASCLIPGTCTEIIAYPTLLQMGKIEINLSLTGPVADFTLEQDLVRNCVWIHGKAKEGFYRLRLEASDAGFSLFVERGPLGINGKWLKSKDKLHFPAEVDYVLKADLEMLSLGNNKAQDWDQVQKRADLKEILPVLFCLGQKLPRIPTQPLKGTARLLEFPENRSAIYDAWIAFFKAAFTKILIPRLIDDQHQGLSLEEPVSGSRHFLIQEGAKHIRRLFFMQNDRRIQLLPLLPIPLDAGRMTGLKAPGIGIFDFEWTKKIIRRAVLRAQTSGEVLFDLKEVDSFRVNQKKRHRAGEPFLVEEGKTYYLDRFQK